LLLFQYAVMSHLPTNASWATKAAEVQRQLLAEAEVRHLEEWQVLKLQNRAELDQVRLRQQATLDQCKRRYKAEVHCLTSRFSVLLQPSSPQSTLQPNTPNSTLQPNTSRGMFDDLEEVDSFHVPPSPPPLPPSASATHGRRTMEQIKSAPGSTCAKCVSYYADDPSGRKVNCLSRHRESRRRGTTPPGYWRTDFEYYQPLAGVVPPSSDSLQRRPFKPIQMDGTPPKVSKGWLCSNR
jgi:hypothetical protein